MKLTSIAWLAGFFLLMQGADARLHIEGLNEDDPFVVPRIVGSFTIPDIGRQHGGTQQVIGSTEGFIFRYGQGEQFGRLFELNSALVSGGKVGLPFRRYPASSVQPLSNVRVVELNPKVPEIVATAFTAGLQDSSLDTVILFGDQVVLGRVDAADVTGTTINVDHPLAFSGEAIYQLLSVIGETLIKIVYDGGELEVVSGGVPIGHIELLRGPEASIELRNGFVRVAKVMGPLFDGDTILTGAETSVRATFVDQTVADLGPDSELKVEEIRKEETSILDLIKGYIRMWVREDPYLPAGVDKIKLRAGRRHIFICQRGGADFSANVVEEAGSVSVGGAVAQGNVDFVDNRTGNRVVLEAGESRTSTFLSDDGNSTAEASPVALNTLINSEISPSFDIDYYRFELLQGGEVTVESFGSLDTIGDLYDSAGKLIAGDDDADDDEDRNFRITKSLRSGVYFSAVRGYEDRWGPYDLKITYTPPTGPDTLPPAILFDPLPQFSKAPSFVLSASVSDDRVPESLSYRIKPPGSKFLPWRRVLLGGGGLPGEWSTPLGLTKEGRWQVEIQARDAAGNKSETGTIAVIADRTKPTAQITSASSVRSASYRLKANVADRAQLASVRYRLKEPKATQFGAWSTVNLDGNKLKQAWSRLLTLRKTGTWRIEVQAVDAAGNASKTAAFKVNRTK